MHNLVPQHLTNQNDLNSWEQFNIARSERWATNRKRSKYLTIEFIRLLHKKMFEDTWKWAGNFRTYQTNIGVNSIYINQELLLLLDDIKYWQQNNVYPLREIAIRLHHQLVWIHPFPNGNGRLARLLQSNVKKIWEE